MEKIKIGIVGYGNLGRGVQYAAQQNDDMEVVAVFTRRDPADVATILPVKVERYEDMKNYIGKINVMILCGGSATDLPKQSAEVVKMFNIVDSFDTHAKVPEHFAALEKAAKETGHLGGMSIGWEAVHTLFGAGVSAKGTAMRSAALRASRMRGNIPYPSRARWKGCAEEKILYLLPGRNTRGSVTSWPKRGRI